MEQLPDTIYKRGGWGIGVPGTNILQITMHQNLRSAMYQTLQSAMH